MKERQRKPAYRKALKAWEINHGQITEPNTAAPTPPVETKKVVDEPLEYTPTEVAGPVVDQKPEVVDPLSDQKPEVAEPVKTEKPELTGNDVTILEVVTKARDVLRVCGSEHLKKILKEEGGGAENVHKIDSKRWPAVVAVFEKSLADISISKKDL